VNKIFKNEITILLLSTNPGQMILIQLER